MQVLHLLDKSAGWEQRAALAQLRAKFAAGAIRQTFASIDPGVSRRVQLAEAEVVVVRRRGGLPAMAGSGVRRVAESCGADVIHAWGVDATAAARAAYPQGKPLVSTVFDPGLSARDVRVLRTVADGGSFAVGCAADRVRRRLVEQGVPFGVTAILRPGVDFASLSAVTSAGIRSQLNLPEAGLLLLLAAPVGTDDGPASAVWSGLMRWYLDERTRIVVPGEGPGIAAVRRIAQTSACPEAVVFTEDRVPFESLCVAADYLVIGSTGEIPMTAAAWAMAASTPVVAPATYATTEMLSDGLNAVLFKNPENWRRRGAVLAAQFDRTENLPKIKEVARGQAYEVFSLRRSAEQTRQLYENLLAGDEPAKDITDPAMQTV